MLWYCANVRNGQDEGRAAAPSVSHPTATIKLSVSIKTGGTPMEHATAARCADPCLRQQLDRILVTDEAAWWFRLLTRAAAAHLAVAFSGAMAESIVRDLHGQPLLYKVGSGPQWAAAVAAALVGIYSFFTMQDPLPPKQRLNRRQWETRAKEKGTIVGFGVAYILFWTTTTLLEAATHLLISIEQRASLSWMLSVVIAVVFLVVFAALCVGLPGVLGVYAFNARRQQELEILDAVTPAELRLAAEIYRRAEAFRAQAEALEQAIEQAAAISEQVQL
jgi:ABC-type Fe3+-siderophore transport system permease subunit